MYELIGLLAMTFTFGLAILIVIVAFRRKE